MVTNTNPTLPRHPLTPASRGILIQYFIQYGASFADGGPKAENQGTAAFRIPWGIQMVPGAILFVGMFFLPRSPRWLAGKDRWEEALQVLANLHGNGDVNHPKVLAEYHEIEEALRFEREEAMPMATPATTRPTQSRATPLQQVWRRAPSIQMTEATWMAVRREYLSAMKDELNAPTREPAGMEAVIPPWR